MKRKTQSIFAFMPLFSLFSPQKKRNERNRKNFSGANQSQSIFIKQPGNKRNSNLMKSQIYLTKHTSRSFLYSIFILFSFSWKPLSKVIKEIERHDSTFPENHGYTRQKHKQIFPFISIKWKRTYVSEYIKGQFSIFTLNTNSIFVSLLPLSQFVFVNTVFDGILMIYVSIFLWMRNFHFLLKKFVAPPFDVNYWQFGAHWGRGKQSEIHS